MPRTLWLTTTYTMTAPLMFSLTIISAGRYGSSLRSTNNNMHNYLYGRSARSFHKPHRDHQPHNTGHTCNGGESVLIVTRVRSTPKIHGGCAYLLVTLSVSAWPSKAAKYVAVQPAPSVALTSTPRHWSKGRTPCRPFRLTT